MPFKSQAQRRKFAQLLVEGKISNETFEEWNRETGSKRLPERVTRKAKSARRASAKATHSRAAFTETEALTISGQASVRSRVTRITSRACGRRASGRVILLLADGDSYAR